MPGIMFLDSLDAQQNFSEHYECSGKMFVDFAGGRENVFELYKCLVSISVS
jgi:hypothetical protein